MALHIDVTLDGLHQLQGRIDQRQLDDHDWALFGAFVSNMIAREESKYKRLLAKIAAAQAMTAARAQEQSDAVADSSHDVINVEHTAIGVDGNMPKNVPPSGAEGDAKSTAASSSNGKDDKRAPGHGRNGAAAYSNAKDFYFALLAGIIGSICAACKAGRMKRHRDLVTIRVVGQPMFGAERYHAEQARCDHCGRVVNALPPNILDGIGKAVTYDWSACALLIVLHYFYGLPFKRLEALQQSWGIPFADANQWEVASGAMTLVAPMINALIRFAIQTMTAFRMDDTGSVVLTIKQQIAAELAAAKALGLPEDSVRRGVNTSGFYIDTPEGTVLLYFTGRHHAAEMLRELLKQRLPDAGKVLKVTDGASKNFLGPEYADLLEDGVCNVHAFLKFYDIKDQYPMEYAIVGEAYDKIYAVDETAKISGMSPEERLAYHQKHSRPWMEKIKALCDDKITRRLVEPNAPLWEAVHFFINQWSLLTKFLAIAGMPLDTNLCEQSLIAPVRYLAASFNFHTERGAKVGDHGMSLVATGRANGVEPVAWISDCLKNHKDLAQNPEKYFPWAYRERVKAKRKESASPPDLFN